LDDLVIEGPFGHATDTASPVDYFPGQDRRARRFTLHRDGKQVLFFDYYVSGDTRYGLYVEVEPEFRDGKWIEVVSSIQKKVSNYLNQPRVVWLKVSPWLAKSMPNMLATVETLNEKDITFIKSVYVEGAVNNIFNV
jgi:hypothetical protein